MITVCVYTHGGNVFSGEMTEHEAIDLVALWSSQGWKKSVLSLAVKDKESVSLAYVLYSQIAAIDYVLGL